MNPLHLSGYGVKLCVRDMKSHSELEVSNGKEDGKLGLTTRFRPRRFPYSSVVIDGHSGYVTLQAFHWLSRNNVPLFVMNYDGRLISSLMPPIPVRAELRKAQFDAQHDPVKALSIAKALVDAKVQGSLKVMEWMNQHGDTSREIRQIKKQLSQLPQAKTVSQARTLEAKMALFYWTAFVRLLPEHLQFQARITKNTQKNASDPVNAALNYGYGYLQAECLKAVTEVGLEPSVGFLHVFDGAQSRMSLVYDLMEPYRWLVDLTVMHMFLAKQLGIGDFYFTGDDYTYRFMPDPKVRFLRQLRLQFTNDIASTKPTNWSAQIQEKTQALGRCLIDPSKKLDFALRSGATVLSCGDTFAHQNLASSVLRER